MFGNPLLRRYTVLALITCALCFPLSCRGEAPPWDASFFTSSGAEILKAAQGIATSPGEAVVLLDEATFRYDSEGRLTSRYRKVFRILNTAGLDHWGTVSASWSPWYQQRPSIRARVISPDGTVHPLRPEAVIDSPLEQDKQNMFDDQRVLRAPLPALKVGAVVEQEVVLVEKVPLFGAGTTHRFFFGYAKARTVSSRLVLEAPTSVPLRWKSELLPGVAPARDERDGIRRVTYTVPELKPLEDVENWMPGDLPRWPCVVFGSGKSWTDVAATYAGLADRSMAAAKLAPVVQKVIGDARGRNAVAARLLAYVRREIRYTGVELGASSIVPHPPEETLRLKYGDCKDQATLLVKLLRTAGVPAYLALLRNGPGQDVEEQMPGLGEFNHAIVFVPGSPALWIDPTEPFRPLGELPLYAQGRLALIASGETSGLSRTPQAPSSENRIEQTREFRLKETGSAVVTETSERWGSAAAGYRSAFERMGKEEQRKALEKYVSSEYRGDAVSFTSSAVLELDRPFRLHLEIPASKRGLTDDAEAAVAIFADAVLKRLPDELTQDEPAEAQPRRHDFLIWEPYAEEVRYRIVPPEGYRAKALPKDEKTDLGPMRFSRSFRLERDGAVTVLQRFDTRKRRLTPAEFQAAGKVVRRLLAEKAVLITFEQRGNALMSAGRVREALAEFRRLAALHPKEALHHLQAASALISVGVTGAALAEAETAVKLEPRSAVAHRILAWGLEHDAAGRLRGSGYDRKRAIAEYRAAIALDPADYAAHVALAILLEHDGDGVRFGPKSDPGDAIKEYLTLRDELKRKDLDENLIACLVNEERWGDLKQIAPTLNDRNEGNACVIVAIAATEGAEAAIAEGKRLIADPAARGKGVETAAATLARRRRYREASQLLAEAARGGDHAASLSSRSRLLNSVQRFETLRLDEHDPTTLVKQVMMSLLAPESAPVPFFKLFAAPMREAMEKELQEGKGDGWRYELEQSLKAKTGDLPNAVALDIALAHTKYRLEGSDAVGYRITMFNTLTGTAPDTRVIVTREGEGYRLVASNSKPELAGMEVMRRLDRGDLEGARTLLDWAGDELKPAGDAGRLSTLPYRTLWPQSGIPNAQQMRLAAAALLAQLDGEGMIPILKAGRENAEPGLAEVLDLALVQCYLNAKQFEKVLPLVEKLIAAHPGSGTLRDYRIGALQGLRRWDVLQSLAEARLKKQPDDHDALRLLAKCRERQGDFDQAARTYRRLVDEGSRLPVDYNNLAWLGLFQNKIPADAVALAEQAVTLAGGKAWSGLHTLAMLYAETGKPAAARETILKAIDVSGTPVVTSSAWYVLGVIAKQYGENRAAQEAFARVAPADPEKDLPDSVPALLEKRHHADPSSGSAAPGGAS